MPKGKRNRAGLGSSKPKGQQVALESVSMLPLLKKPFEEVGKSINIPGTHWGSAARRGDAQKRFVCVVKDFSYAHRTGPDDPPQAAFFMSEMGVDGHGGTSVDFWLTYPHPFLRYYYDTFPELLELPKSKATECTPTEVEEKENEDTKRRSIALKYMKATSSDKVRAGPQKGRLKHVFVCQICEAGKMCGSSITLYGNTTGAFFKHVRRKAQKAGYAAHAEVLQILNESSSRQVQLADGSWVTVFSFEESFPHHIRFVWLVAGGLPARLSRRPMFKDYIKGYEPRAVFPHHETVHRIVECIDSLQQRELQIRISFGLQLDLWTDRNSGVCYAAVHLTMAVETESTLELRDDLLEFQAFPFTEHTAQNIKTWLLELLQKKDIPLKSIVGITPDGAADGTAAIKLIPELKHTMDVCSLHQLQRSVLYSIGLAGTATTCKNRLARDLIRQHKRVVQLSHQSREVSDGFRKAQKAAGIPKHKFISTVRTNATRWGNQFTQISRNCFMRPIQDEVLTQYKRENIGETVLIEADGDEEYDSDDAVPRTPFAASVAQVTRRDVGLTTEMWNTSLELEAFLDRPAKIKDLTEKCPYLTGAQMLFCMLSLKAANTPDKDLMIKTFPKDLSLAQRKRPLATLKANSIHPMVSTARSVLSQELDERFFGERPSEARLVQLMMSKQADATKLLPPEWVEQGAAFYVSWLRKAATANNVGTRVSPQRAAAKKARVSGNLFDGLLAPPAPVTDDTTQVETGAGSDAVVNEQRLWKVLSEERITPFIDTTTGMLNEFKLLFALRKEFPLHYFLFKQVSVHISHEANVETTFSLSKSLSSDNTHTGIDFLSRVTRIQKNKTNFNPHATAVLDEYIKKFSKAELGDDVEPVEITDESSDESSDDDVVASPAPSAAPGPSNAVCIE